MPEKIFIETDVLFHTDGKMTPKFFIWEGKTIKIDEVKNVSITLGSLSGGPAAAAKYACSAKGKDVNLYFDVNKWYVREGEVPF
jgi:hypothetical protein